MSQPFLAEIKMAGFNFAPRGYALCNGQLLAISQNTAVFSLLGTNYGGNGTTNFGLPNLQGRTPLHQGSGPGLTPRNVGEAGGSESVTLGTTELAPHTHAALGDATAGGASSPVNNTWGKKAARTPQALYSSGPANAAMSPLSLAPVGGGLPHNNRSPYLALNFFIALQGIFPARN
ncbi:MAG: tail fiber protein [Vicinamibacteria bacterium]|nr:tail fiber protein [Vicinamibacteria bacterium]